MSAGGVVITKDSSQTHGLGIVKVYTSSGWKTATPWLYVGTDPATDISGVILNDKNGEQLIYKAGWAKCGAAGTSMEYFNLTTNGQLNGSGGEPFLVRNK